MHSNDNSPLQGEYGQTQHPECPSPEASITILNPSHNLQNTEVTAIFDSGAVMTCIPESQVEQLGTLHYSSKNVRGANNTTFERRTYIVNIQLENHLFTNIEVIALPKNYALIGRDILNQYKVTFNAPQNTWIYNCQGSCSIDT